MPGPQPGFGLNGVPEAGFWGFVASESVFLEAYRPVAQVFIGLVATKTVAFILFGSCV